MTDQRFAFWEKARSCMPPGMQDLKPGAIAVAVVKPDVGPEGPRSDIDYLWVRCPGRFPASRIHAQAKESLALQDDLVLSHVHKDIPIDLEMPIKDFAVPGNNLVVLQTARKAVSAPRAPPTERHPLSPTNRHMANQFIKREPSQNLAKVKAEDSELHRYQTDGQQDENRPVGQPQFGILRPQDSWRPSPAPMAYPSPISTSPGWGTMPPSPAVQTPIYNPPFPQPNAHPSMQAYNSPTPVIPEPYPSTNNDQDDANIHAPLPQDQEIEEEPSFQLHALLKDAEPEILELSVKKGLNLLDKLRQPLMQTQTSPDASQWITQIDHLRKQAVPTRTVIGVVGNTGAGKSSVINAMLDEERLVPTNCMRACTAVVTELSYNHGQKPYRAEIEFITAQDWRKELETLFRDLLDLNGGVSRECANEDSDAGIAYAKIKAVYPQKTKEDIANSSIDKMLDAVSSLLGTTKSIEKTDAPSFYTALQHYVDSKEKVKRGEKKDKKEKKKKREMEYWPLIRKVKIFVKSPALSTGAVIVDLPGVHDSNAARAAVAEGYMKECTGLWIVAPINRAVDDKAAKTLLGESFKRQLKMDGGFNAVTFICSKTDDISLLEAQDSLDLEEDLGALWAEIDQTGKELKRLKKQREEAKETKAVYSDLMNAADDELEEWDGMKDEVEDGKIVYAPKAKSSSKKRKARGSPKSRKKRRASSESESNSDNSTDEDYNDAETSDESESENVTKEPLSEEQISSKISEIKAKKKKARLDRADIERQIKKLDAEIKPLEHKETTIEAEIAAKCIAGRNEYSKGAIQQDFAAGIKELDEEIAAEDDENFNPDVDIRNYEEVAESLKCFCVSSRAYQKLSGRLQKDPSVPGFRTVEETELPQLQAHCKELTKAGRSANCRRFINNLSQLLNSLALWASSDGTGENLTAEQREREAKTLTHNFKKLEDGLDKAVASTCKDLGEEFGDNIFDRYQSAVDSAVNDATRTATKWGWPVNREQRELGGVAWSTYKAICRRDGVFTNAQGPHEWNAQLAEPMMKVIAIGWEKMFSRRAPMVMASFPRNAIGVLKDFHHNVAERARKIGLGIAGLHGLKQQISVHENILKDVSREATDTINASQKEINRCFIPIIQTNMENAYTACVDEHGPGSYMRMKAAMTQHVDVQRHVMFQQSVDEVRSQLKTLLKDLEAKMNDKTDEIFVSIKRDYRAVLGGGEGVPQGQLLPRSERLSRKEILRIIDGIEAVFRRIAEGVVLEEEADGEATTDEHKVEQLSGSGPRSSLKLQEDGWSDGEIGKPKRETKLRKDQTMTGDCQSATASPTGTELPDIKSIIKPTSSGQDDQESSGGSTPFVDKKRETSHGKDTQGSLDAQLTSPVADNLPSGPESESESSDGDYSSGSD